MKGDAAMKGFNVKKYLIIIAVCAIIAIIVYSSGTNQSSTNAAYRTEISGTDGARVAKWEWLYEKDSSDKVKIDLFNDSKVYELNTLNEPGTEADLHVSQGKALIAPGTGGKFELKVTNNSEVTGKVSFDFNV